MHADSIDRQTSNDVERGGGSDLGPAKPIIYADSGAGSGSGSNRMYRSTPAPTRVQGGGAVPPPMGMAVLDLEEDETTSLHKPAPGAFWRLRPEP